MATVSEKTERATGETTASDDIDIGLQFLAQHGQVEYTEDEDRRVRWKIDLYLLPILMVTFGLQYLDKVTLSYAAVYNMRDDLGMTGQDYSWATSIFYFGYLAGEFPANYLLQRLPTGKFAAWNLLVWGALVMLSGVARNFAGMAALRFLMGFFEAGIPPAWIQITAMFYKVPEQGTRCTAWYFMVGVAAIVGGLLSYGVGHIHTAVQQWQFVFLLCGAITVAWAVVVFLFLPDSPANAKFLSERERTIAIERLRHNRTGVKNTHFKLSQLVEALRDPQVWIFVLYNGISMQINIGGSFLPIIIQNMGFTGLQTTLLTLPVGGVECIAMAVAGALSWYFAKGRTLIMFVVALPTLVGGVLLQVLPQSSTWGRATGVWLLLCIPASYAIMLSLIASNVAGTTKKLTTTLLSFVIFCVGNIVGPQLFRDTEAPEYGTAMRAILVSIVLCELLPLLLGAYYVYENRRRDQLVARMTAEELAAATVDNEEYLDRTDREDELKFRYWW
ncbi:uncharacterized protein BJX67DRAFT_356653 [Aspergillus lucknowensis]|uniref:Major facilitator superfamily (MFS) profile domain-containing protein n=1 Tax=Aspergillus lucknowensis TaxID=176173 RepID=A0ABR4LNM4_9EURO